MQDDWGDCTAARQILHCRWRGAIVVRILLLKQNIVFCLIFNGVNYCCDVCDFENAFVQVESFPCGPKKIEILRGKLDEWLMKVGGGSVGAAVAAPSDAGAGAGGSGTNAAVTESAGGAAVGSPSSTTVKADPTAAAAAATAAASPSDLPPLNGDFLKQAAPALFGHVSEEQAKDLVAGAVVTTWSQGDVITEQVGGASCATCSSIFK